METVRLYPSCLRIPTAPCWKPLLHSLATPLQHSLLLHCKSLDCPRGWESFTAVRKNSPITAGDSPWPNVCPWSPQELSAARQLPATLGVLPQAGLADPRHRTAPPAAPCPLAGCRCRCWAQSTSSALSCEQAAGQPINHAGSVSLHSRAVLHFGASEHSGPGVWAGPHGQTQETRR